MTLDKLLTQLREQYGNLEVAGYQVNFTSYDTHTEITIELRGFQDVRSTTKAEKLPQKYEIIRRK